MKCECGCGTEVADGWRFVCGHHWKVQREARGFTDERVFTVRLSEDED